MKMDISTLLNFWKSSKAAKVATITTLSDADTDTVTDSLISDPLSDTDDDDSFFELELTLLNSDSKLPKIAPEPEKTSSKAPQSPITVLRSASPKLRDFMIGKLRRKNHKEDFETESDYSSNISPRSRSNSNLFTVKFKIEDGSIATKFADESNESSKRFSKDVVQKYLSLMKPSFVKSSKLNASPARSTASLPSPRKDQSSRFKVKCKQLGKSKSAPAFVVSPLSFPSRNDHPIDGIEGAILHCKRSLSSSSKN